MATPEPRYFGGQAVIEGVMMRGVDTWAVAVRTTSGGIEVAVRDVPAWGERFRNVAIVRGVAALGESLRLGYRALTWSANQQVPEEERVSERALGWSVLFAVLFFTAVFLVLPAFAGRDVGRTFRVLPSHLAEGVVRLG